MCAADDALLSLETERLLLRPMAEADAPMILRISSDPGTTEYLYFWGRLGSTPEGDVRQYLDYALGAWRSAPIRAREYCVTLKATGEKAGVGSVEWVKGEPGTAELGWILLPEHRGRGYATEMGRALMNAAFETLAAQRVIAHCDDRNAASARVMERLGMTLTEIEKEARPAKRAGEKNGDERTYAITRAQWAVHRAWAEYRGYTCRFDGFPPLPPLTDGVLALKPLFHAPADPARRYVPAYHFQIMRDDQPVGAISLRVGYPDALFYGGQIGYHIDEAHRGHGYAGAACRLLFPVMRLHGMASGIIANNVENAASRRVCEKIGARFLCRADLPPDHDLYRAGARAVNVYALDVP